VCVGLWHIGAVIVLLIIEVAGVGLWARPGLDRRTLSLVSIAILAALGREELALLLRASRNTGATPQEIAEVLLHVAVYAGVPAANAGFAVAKAEFDVAAEGGQPDQR